MKTKPKIRNAVVGLAMLLSGWAMAASGDTAENPYAVIAARNAFDLREIKDEPKAPEPVVEPETEDVDVTLTGFSEIKGVKRAYFMVPDSENPGRFHYYSLKENEGSGPISKVLNIDNENGKVQIQRNNRLMALNLEEHGFKPNQARNLAQNRGRRGSPQRTIVRPSNNRPTPNAQRTSSNGPRIISRGGATNFDSNDQNSGNDRNANSRAAQVRDRMNQTYGLNNDGDSTTAGSLRSIPVRRMRGSNNRLELNPIERTTSAEERAAMALVQKEQLEQQGIPVPPLPFGPNAPVTSPTPNPNGQE